MKKIFTSIAMLLLCFAENLYAQPIYLAQPGLQLQAVSTAIQAHLSPSDTAEGGYADRLSVFNRFWQGRVAVNDSTANDSTGTNMFSQYFQALRTDMADRAISFCGTGGFHGNWNLVGPDSLGTQVVGKVDVVWADPSDQNYVLAGTIEGLFKTTNGGATWRCATTNNGQCYTNKIILN